VSAVLGYLSLWASVFCIGAGIGLGFAFGCRLFGNR
jgi:hypothetical protein